MQSQTVCSGCRSILLYPRGASNVCCALCNTITSVLPQVSNQLAQVSCANCRITLMYPFGAPSVKCAVCQYITNINTSNGRAPVSGSMASSSTEMPHSHTQTVVVENPMSVDENGKLVSNMVFGVTTDKKPS